MFFVSGRFTRLFLIGGAALAVSACGGGETAEESVNQSLDSNLLFEQPANDASALESVADVPEPLPATEESSNSAEEAPVAGNTSGGDTGGNTVEGEDVVGM